MDTLRSERYSRSQVPQHLPHLTIADAPPAAAGWGGLCSKNLDGFVLDDCGRRRRSSGSAFAVFPREGLLFCGLKDAWGNTLGFC